MPSLVAQSSFDHEQLAAEEAAQEAGNRIIRLWRFADEHRLTKIQAGDMLRTGVIEMVNGHPRFTSGCTRAEAVAAHGVLQRIDGRFSLYEDYISGEG